MNALLSGEISIDKMDKHSGSLGIPDGEKITGAFSESASVSTKTRQIISITKLKSGGHYSKEKGYGTSVCLPERAKREATDTRWTRETSDRRSCQCLTRGETLR